MAGRRVGQLHQGLLHGSGARCPHRLPRRQRAAPGPRCAHRWHGGARRRDRVRRQGHRHVDECGRGRRRDNRRARRRSAARSRSAPKCESAAGQARVVGPAHGMRLHPGRSRSLCRTRRASVSSWFAGRTPAPSPTSHAPATVPTSTTSPPPSTAPVDLTGISIPGVDGTTTTAPVRSLGTAHLSRRRQRTDRDLWRGAIVRLEHLVGDTGDDRRRCRTRRPLRRGEHRRRALPGPRLLPPRYAQTDPQVFFLRRRRTARPRPLRQELLGSRGRERDCSGSRRCSAIPPPSSCGSPAACVDNDGIVRVRRSRTRPCRPDRQPTAGPSTGVCDAGRPMATATPRSRSCAAPPAPADVGCRYATAADQPQPNTLATPTCVGRPRRDDYDDADYDVGSSGVVVGSVVAELTPARLN